MHQSSPNILRQVPEDVIIGNNLSSETLETVTLAQKIDSIISKYLIESGHPETVARGKDINIQYLSPPGYKEYSRKNSPSKGASDGDSLSPGSKPSAPKSRFAEVVVETGPDIESEQKKSSSFPPVVSISPKTSPKSSFAHISPARDSPRDSARGSARGSSRKSPDGRTSPWRSALQSKPSDITDSRLSMTPTPLQQ